MSTPAFAGIYRGAVKPKLRVPLTDETGAALNLTGATVRLVAAESLETVTASLAIDVTMTIVGDPLLGIVEHNWLATETDVPAFIYDAQLIITVGGGDPEKSPVFKLPVFKPVEAP